MLDLKLSVEFKLIGILFDSGLTNMDKNYMQALDDIRKVASKWVFKNITLTGRITVAKTYLLSKVSHIAAILPTPSNHLCNSFIKVIYDFTRGKNSEGKT